MKSEKSVCYSVPDNIADIEEQAQERFERIVEQMKQAQGAGDYRIVKGR